MTEALPTLPFDQMVRNIQARLRYADGPAYTLLLGSGFSFPVIPPGSIMLHDIVRWLYLQENGRAKDYFGGPTVEVPGEFQKEFWSALHRACGEKFELKDGLPADLPPENTALAYMAVMSGCCHRGLCDPGRRRQYIRDVIRRAGKRINPANLYLASILAAQAGSRWKFKAPFAKTIFTTNFDSLLQRSLQLADVLYFMTDRPYALENPEDDATDAIHLVYTHGSVHRYYLVNGAEETAETAIRNADRLAPYFKGHGCIVIGYGGWPDSTMQALMRCPTFDGNLYWCDRHSPEVAASVLRKEVVELFQQKAGCAFYVHIPSADEALRMLHDSLGLGQAPEFLLKPLDKAIERLESVVITPPRHADDKVPLSEDPLQAIVALVKDGLAEAQRAFEQSMTARASRLMLKAYTALMRGEADEAIALCSDVLKITGAPAGLRAGALNNRGAAYGKKGETDKAIADYTAVIDDPDAPAEHKAKARVNRGLTYGKKGETNKAIADFTAVIDDPAAPADPKARARVGRGVTYGKKGETDKAIADFTAVIDEPEAPAEQKAWARFNRGATYDKKGETDKAIADYTAVIDALEATAEQKTWARFNRGATYGKKGETDKTIADYTAVIDDPEAPTEQKAKARVNRAVTYGKKGETDKAIADYAAVVDDPETPAEQKAGALVNRGWKAYQSGRVDAMVQDSRAALQISPQMRIARFNLGLGLLLLGRSQEAIEEYNRAAAECEQAEEVQRDGIVDLEEAIKKRGTIAGADEVLKMLYDRVKQLENDTNK